MNGNSGSINSSRGKTREAAIRPYKALSGCPRNLRLAFLTWHFFCWKYLPRLFLRVWITEIWNRPGEVSPVGKAYPQFHSSYSHEELVEHFLLTPAELHFVLTFRGEPNRCGVALLLKVLPYLGYVPEKLGDIPQEVRAFITGQLGLLWDRSDDYPWYTSTRDNHVAQVRKFTDWRFLTAQDKVELEQWLREGAAYESQSAEMLLDAGCGRLQRLRVELPAEGELQRLVNSALTGFFQDIQRHITEAMPTEVRARIDNLLMVPDANFVSEFERMKADSGKPGVDQFQAEIDDEMVKSTVALKLKRGTASAEAILKRYNSYNRTHPTYKALTELGKAEKTIFLCHYLPSRETQREVQEGLNVVENWNATTDFICYGRQAELATNSREQQEVVTLSLQLLQNCLMLINTILLERTIEQEGLWERLSAEDFRALTPLFHGHINPYGQITLDLARPSFLKPA